MVQYDILVIGSDDPNGTDGQNGQTGNNGAKGLPDLLSGYIFSSLVLLFQVLIYLYTKK